MQTGHKTVYKEGFFRIATEEPNCTGKAMCGAMMAPGQNAILPTLFIFILFYRTTI
jgi:hypothetical protein